MNEPCRDRAGDVAALALGGLDPGERASAQAHVDGCAACAVALREQQAVAALLDLAQASPEPVSTPSGLDTRVLAAVDDEQRRRRRRAQALRWAWAGAAALAAVGTLVGVEQSLRTGTGGSVGVEVALSPAPAATTVPTATATLTDKAWGTAIELLVVGSRAGEEYRVWLADDTGTRTPAGSFEGQDRTLTVSLAAALERAEATTLGISTEGADPLLVVSLPEEG